jgi:hypothetical protein
MVSTPQLAGLMLVAQPAKIFDERRKPKWRSF